MVLRRMVSLLVLLVALAAPAGCTEGTADDMDPYADSGAEVSQGAGDASVATPIPATPVVTRPTYKVQRGDIVHQLVINGHVSPTRRADLYFKTGGRIKSVRVRSGEMVRAGQLIADLEMDELERNLAGARLDLDRAQAELKSAEDDRARSARQAQLDLDIARENLAIVKTQDPAPRKAKAEAELQQAALARQRAKRAYDAAPAGPEKETGPEAAALQAAAASYAAAKAALDLAMQEVAALGHRVTIAERQVDLAQLKLDGIAAEADPLLANDVQQAQFRVDGLHAALADAQIVAPFDGEVQVAFALSPGSAADAYRYLASVADIAELEITGDIANVPIDQVSAGMPATVSPVGRPGVNLAAHIRQVPSADLGGAAQERTLKLTLDDASRLSTLQNGELLRITLVLEQRPGVLWLPPQAIRTFEGRKFVVLQDDSSASGGAQRRVDVKLGLETESRVEIVDGLTEGQTVVAP